jgi:mRNA degradation ribonuclease J1/J2
MPVYRPWRLDQDNDQGIVIKDDVGNIVHTIDYRAIPTERGAAFRQQLVRQARDDAHAMIDCVNGMAEEGI